jgi:hypothetical protein
MIPKFLRPEVVPFASVDLIARKTDSEPVPVIVCAWHTPKLDLDAINRRFPGQVSHVMCPQCVVKFIAQERG